MKYLLCLLLTIHVARAESLDRAENAQATNNLKQLSTLIVLYNDDYRNGKRDHASSPFPANLTTLVTEGYLSEQDFKKLTESNRVTYFPPTGEGDPKLPILYTRTEDCSIFGFASGQVDQIRIHRKNETNWFLIAVGSFLLGALSIYILKKDRTSASSQ